MGIIRTFVQQIMFRSLGAMGQYNAAFAPPLTDGEACILQLDINGNLLVSPGAGIIWVVGGPAAQDAPVSGNPVEISFEASHYVKASNFSPNVPVSADGDVVRPRASLYGVQYTMAVSQNGSDTVQWFGGQANPSPNPTYGVMNMGIRRDNPNPPLEADNTVIPLSTDEHGALWVALDPYVDPMNATDGAFLAGDRGVLVHALRNDNAATVYATVNGHYLPFAVDDRGQLFVRFGPNSGGPVYAEDSASTDGELGFSMLVVRRDAPASSGGSDGDHVTINQDADGFDYVHEKAFDSPSNADSTLERSPLWNRNIGTPIPLIAAAQNIGTGFAAGDLGPEIPVLGFTRIGLWLNLTIGTGTNLRVRMLVKHTSAGTDEYPVPIKVLDGNTPFNVKVEGHYYEFNIDASQQMYLDWEVDNTIPFVQFQIMALTAGGPPTVVSAFVTLGYGA